MSGFIGVAATVVSELIGAVTIGDVTLYGFEVPENLKWGGKQKLEIHKLPGGDRVFDILGADDAPIEWSGYFSGPLAGYRARSIDAMRTAGVPVTLSWPGFTRTVIIESFTCNSARGGFLLPYSISCEVIPDPTTSDPSIFDQVVNDFQDATGIDVGTASILLGGAMAAVQTAEGSMPPAGPLTDGAAATIAVANSVNAASATIAQNLAINEVASASMVVNPPNVLGSVNPYTAATNLINAMVWTGNEAGLTVLQGYVGRIAKNIANAGG
jgi:hypothetical protein